MTLVTGRLNVNGFSLFYEIRGSGRILILIPGINGSAVVFKNLATHLSVQFKVVTYDRRGFHRSHPLDGSSVQAPASLLAANGQDVCSLIEHISPSKSAIVLGVSGGAAIAIEALKYNPEVVQRLVLHEPTIFSLFEQEAQESMRPWIQETLDLLNEAGPIAAAQAFLPLVPNEADQIALRAAPFYLQILEVAVEGLGYFFHNELEKVFEYNLDLDLLKRHQSKLCLLQGTESDLYINVRPVEMISETLGFPIMLNVGGHSGYITHGEVFARDFITLMEGERVSL